MSNFFEIPVGDEQEQGSVDADKRAATAELVETLLDCAEYFADVENWALEHHGFTVDNLKELVDEETGPLNFYQVGYDFKPEEIDWEAAVRSLNEEFGYSQDSKRVFLRLQSYRVDELGRERIDLELNTREWSPGDDVEEFMKDVRRQVEILLRGAQNEGAKDA